MRITLCGWGERIDQVIKGIFIKKFQIQFFGFRDFRWPWFIPRYEVAGLFTNCLGSFSISKSHYPPYLLTISSASWRESEGSSPVKTKLFPRKQSGLPIGGLRLIFDAIGAFCFFINCKYLNKSAIAYLACFAVGSLFSATPSADLLLGMAISSHFNDLLAVATTCFTGILGLVTFTGDSFLAAATAVFG